MKVPTLTLLLLGILAFSGQASDGALADTTASGAADHDRESRLAKAEAARGGNFGQYTNVENERRNYPFVAYADEADKVRQESKQADAPASAKSNYMAGSGGPTMLDLASIGAMQVSLNEPLGSVKAANWTYAAVALELLNFLTPSDPRSKAARTLTSEDAKAMNAAEALRLLPVTTPSISFIKPAPNAREREELLAEVRAGQEMITALGLGCEPALWHGPDTPAFVGVALGVYSHTRKFVCGYAPGETLAEANVSAEVKEFAVVGYTAGTPRARFSLSNLPQMSRMAQVLGVPPGKEMEMGRIAYERVRERIPAEWTTIITAPNKDGHMTVFVAQGDSVIEFAPVPKKR